MEQLQSHLDVVEGLDISSDLLAVAQKRLPGVPLHRADMVDFALGRRFDMIICMFSAISYVETQERMRAAVANMAAHLRPGGLLIVEPWFSPEKYWINTITANHFDSPELKISWMYTSRREKQVAILDIHYLVGTSECIEYFSEQHRMGLFTNDEYVKAFRSAGLEVTYDPEGPRKRGLFVARLPDRPKIS